MENIYDDEIMPENYEQIAKAYSKHLKNKGFVFVRLEDEEFHLLVGEVLVVVAKMLACLDRLEDFVDSKLLKERLCDCQNLLMEKFGQKKPHKFKCVENENDALLILVALENLLTIKLMILSIKSGELELCHDIITSIVSVFAESFPWDGFVVQD